MAVASEISDSSLKRLAMNLQGRIQDFRMGVP